MLYHDITEKLISQIEPMVKSSNLEDFELAIEILHKRDRSSEQSEEHFYKFVNELDEDLKRRLLSTLLKKSINEI